MVPVGGGLVPVGGGLQKDRLADAHSSAYDGHGGFAKTQNCSLDTIGGLR